MTINLTDFYDVGKIEFWRTSINVPMYDIELISKSTGEVITWSFTEEYFDKFLNELEEDTKYLEESLYYTRKKMWWFLWVAYLTNVIIANGIIKLKTNLEINYIVGRFVRNIKDTNGEQQQNI